MAKKTTDILEIIEPKDVFVGAADAPVTLVMYGDYESRECGEANEVVKKLLEQYEGKMKFNFRHFPLTRIHQKAQKAAEAAVAAAQNGKFWEMHNIMFNHRTRLGSISLKEYANDAGVQNKNFLYELANSTYGWHVRADLLEGLEKGVRDVPAFFVNEERYEGNPTLAGLKKVIDAAVKVAKPVAKKRA